MSERYQIKAKIGQGGIGAVYRAFDSHLQREVAVKRLLPPDESEAFEDDPTKTLFKEAHLLSALQHPNVVSVYDVGSDDDGMFVVMELVDGETFDQVVERGLLTEDDFAEMVAQTLEALIAAQEKNLVHRDIKPTNLMVKWLPSGKFQFKLLDFGLAKFSPRPTKQTIGLNDAILGSIHFMAPEQFERKPLDARTDLYAMGCMYYYGLSGRYPFDGDTAAEVMASHLSHRVTPLADLRPDIGRRACDWVMWLMNRKVENRPRTAQEALEVFFNPEFAVPTGSEKSTGRLIIPPGGTPTPVLTRGRTPTGRVALPATGPVGAGSGPVRAGSGPIRAGSGPIRAGSGPVRAGSGPVRAGSGPMALRGGKVRTSPVARAGGNAPQVASHQSVDGLVHTEGEPTQPHRPIRPNRPIHRRKSLIVSVVSAALLIGIGVILLSQKGSHRAEIARITAYLDSQDQSADAVIVRDLIRYLTPPADVVDRDSFVRAVIGKLSEVRGDGVERAILQGFEQSSDIRQERLIQVIANRSMREAVPALNTIVAEDRLPNSRLAIEALSELGDHRDAGTLADAIANTRHSSLRQLAEQALEVMIRNSNNPEGFMRSVEAMVDSSNTLEARRAGLRLLGQIGTERAATILQRTIESGDNQLHVAAIQGMREWPNTSVLPFLLSLVENHSDEAVRDSAFEAYVVCLSVNRENTGTAAQHEAMWRDAARLATGRQRKGALIWGLAQSGAPFAVELIDSVVEDEGPDLRQLADEAKLRLRQ